jgi:hypothetical protein
MVGFRDRPRRALLYNRDGISGTIQNLGLRVQGLKDEKDTLLPSAQLGQKLVRDRNPRDTASMTSFAIVINHGGSHGATLFATASGLLGCCWGMIKVGDIVALIAGADAPLISRPLVQGDTYCFICPAYIPGIMYGEAWDEKKPLEECPAFTLV